MEVNKQHTLPVLFHVLLSGNSRYISRIEPNQNCDWDIESILSFGPSETANNDEVTGEIFNVCQISTMRRT